MEQEITVLTLYTQMVQIQYLVQLHQQVVDMVHHKVALVEQMVALAVVQVNQVVLVEVETLLLLLHHKVIMVVLLQAVQQLEEAEAALLVQVQMLLQAQAEEVEQEHQTQFLVLQ